MIEKEIPRDPKEERRLAIVKELAELEAKGIEDNLENEIQYQRIKELEAELLEIAPPPK